jgi:diguanylate cyclase (GGDEF)-like protein/PAS domain S-box-containing protein
MVITPLSILSVIYMNFWMRKIAQKVENLSFNKEIYEQVIENTDKVFWLTDTGKHRMIYVSPACKEIFGQTTEKLYQSPRSWLDVLHPDDRNRIIEASQIKQVRGEYDEEYRILKPDGSIRWIHESACPIRNALGNVYRIAGVAEDITDQKQRGATQCKKKEAHLSRETKQTGEIIQSIVEGLSGEKGQAFFDSLIKNIANSLKMDYGFIGELTGANNQIVKTVATFARDQVLSPFEYSLSHTPCETVVGGKLCIYPHDVIRLFPNDPLLREMEVESYIGTPLFDSGGQPIGLMVLMDRKPVTHSKMVESLLQSFVVRVSIELERKRLEETLQRLEYHDPMTGLPNQLFFFNLLKEAIQQAERNQDSFAVILIDLNRFKEINDTIGFHRGNFLLQKVGKRIEAILGQPDSVARIGGDEFGLILPKATAEYATQFGSKILNTLREPFEIEGLPVCVEAKIGTALYPDEGTTPDNLILKAEIALYTSKRAAKTAYTARNDANKRGDSAVMGEIILQSVSLIKDLHQSLENGELFLVYQPRVDLYTKRVTGVEALIRWRHPKHGIIQPGQFLSAAEKTEMMKPLNLFVLKEAVNQCRLWNESGRKINVAVNLARQNVLDPSLPDQIENLLQTCNINPAWLEIEIAESMMKSDRGQIANTIVQISRKGIGVTLDNFGFLASSMDYLKNLPIHSIKIDRSYVTDAMISPDHAMVVKSAIEFAHDQGLKVIAVGVEDQESLDQLVTFGCDEAQGYYICRPVLAEELTPWIDESFRDSFARK